MPEWLREATIAKNSCYPCSSTRCLHSPQLTVLSLQFSSSIFATFKFWHTCSSFRFLSQCHRSSAHTLLNYSMIPCSLYPLSDRCFLDAPCASCHQNANSLHVACGLLYSNPAQHLAHSRRQQNTNCLNEQMGRFYSQKIDIVLILYLDIILSFFFCRFSFYRTSNEQFSPHPRYNFRYQLIAVF